MPTRQQLMQVLQIQTEIAKLGLDLGGVMQFIVEQTLPLINADGAAIELAEDGEMVYRAASGIATPQLGLRLRIDASLSGLSVMTGKILTCTDAETDARVDSEACRKVGLRSMIVMPLKHHGVTVGVLKAMSRQPDKFGRKDKAVLALLSEVVAAAMYFSAKYDSDNLFIRATHDSLTGLANRALFMDRLRSAAARSNRERAASGLLMIDMDGLKQINDSHGHRIGDAVLIEFSSRLRELTRDTDTAARLGGDEFGIVLSPLDGATGIEAAMARIDAEYKRPFLFEGKSIPLRASIGSALIPCDGTDPEKIMDLADQRMYKAKKARKSRPDLN